MGGKSTPAVGFGLGIERLLLRLAETGVQIPESDPIKLYIASMGERAKTVAQKIVYNLRREGISVDTDHMERGLRASMKYADKLGVQYTVVLGDNEIDTDEVNVKNMTTGESVSVKIADLANYLK